MQEFKPNYRPLGSDEDDVVDPWSEQTDGPFDHERFETLTVLARDPPHRLRLTPVGGSSV
jgi:hypothetical protein